MTTGAGEPRPQSPPPPTTILFVPGNRPDRFAKAVASGADAVVVDLEDAVDHADKAAARSHARAWLSTTPGGWIRINGCDTPWFDDDLVALADLPALGGVLIPKAEDDTTVSHIRAWIGATPELVALIETAVGVTMSYTLADHPAVTRLAFGSVDFALDINSSHDDAAFQLARNSLVLASRVAGLPAPVDGVTVNLDDENAVTEAARYARSLGFGGKLCIHPKQVQPAARAFAPSEHDLAWAERVVAAGGGMGARVVDGSMIDKPVVERARRLLDAAHRSTVRPGGAR